MVTDILIIILLGIVAYGIMTGKPIVVTFNLAHTYEQKQNTQPELIPVPEEPDPDAAQAILGLAETLQAFMNGESTYEER